MMQYKEWNEIDTGNVIMFKNREAAILSKLICCTNDEHGFVYHIYYFYLDERNTKRRLRYTLQKGKDKVFYIREHFHTFH